jgi:hypothetical protein
MRRPQTVLSVTALAELSSPLGEKSNYSDQGAPSIGSSEMNREQRVKR